MRNFILFVIIIAFFVRCNQAEKGFEKDYASMVDTRMGTMGQSTSNGLASGFTFFGATYPFGMMQFTPSHFAPHTGIAVNQLSGAGCPHMGNFPVLAFSGELEKSPNDMQQYPYFKEIKKSEAGYLSLQFKDDVLCETTISKRSGIARFTFPNLKNQGTVILGSGIAATNLSESHVEITSPRTCEGWAKGGNFCGSDTDYKVYFVAEFNRKSSKTGTWIKEDMLDGRNEIGETNSGAFFVFDTSKDPIVEYKIAISYVSVENARENLKEDNADRDFENVLKDTRLEWNKKLGMIDVGDADPDRMKQFYTHLYHSLIHPNIFSDVNGQYMGGDFKVHSVESGRDYYSTFSGWDTYHTQSQLIAMLYPKESSDMAQSLVDFAKQSGGYGRWILANIETGIMHGDPSSIIVANTYAFGGRNFDVATAYEYMKKGATIPGTRSQNVEVRPGLANYIEKGIENASLCLEYTSADYAIGQFALQALKNKEDADFFINRAGNWRNLYDPSTNWLRSRHNHDMSWKNPNDDWREATKENYFWMVPFDLPTLIDTIGGKRAAEERLDSLFVRIDGSYDDHYFASGNEPDFQVPWIYNWVDKSSKTSAIVSRILREAYNSTPSGLPGNDDCGAMGAWYVFASIGMYPMIPGVGGFTLNMPQFEDITINLINGILKIQGGKDGCSIGGMTLNGNPYSSTWLDWKDIVNGGNIKYTSYNAVHSTNEWGIK